jgi:hypothetical protein
MSGQDWVFALHLVAAATVVGGLVMSWIVTVALWGVDDPEGTLGLSRVSLVSTVAVAVGLPAVLALGIWVAVLRPQLHPWHGWAIAAIVLWGIAVAAIVASTAVYERSTRKAKELVAEGISGSSSELRVLNRTTRGLALKAVASTAIVLIVIDMIYKPGA